MLLYNLFDEYLYNYIYSDNSKYNAERIIIKLKEYFTNKNIKEITKKQINDYISYLYNVEMATKSYTYLIFQRLKAIFNYAIKHDYLKENPCKGVEITKVRYINRVTSLDYSKKNIKEILKTFKGSNLYNFVYLDLHTGMRKGELLALNKKDFIYKKILLFKIPVSVIISNNNVYDFKTHETVIKLPKTNKARVISLDFKCSVFLYRLLKRTKNDNLFNYNTNTVTNLFNSIKKGNPKLKNIRLQDLRHIHACYLLSRLRNNANCIKIVQERLGHTNALQTFNTYAHVIKKDEQKAIKCLNFI